MLVWELYQENIIKLKWKTTERRFDQVLDDRLKGREEKEEITICHLTLKKNIGCEIENIWYNLCQELQKKLYVVNLKIKGFCLYKMHYFFFDVFKIKPIRGSSYFPTPEKYPNPKC